MAKREKIQQYLTDKKIIVFFVLVGGFSILGPFGTYQLFDFWTRVVFWSVVITGIGALMHFCIVMVLDGEIFARLPWLGRVAIGSCVAAVPSVGLILFSTHAMFPEAVSSNTFPLLWFQVAVIGSVAGAFEYRPRAPLPETGPRRSRFHDRLPRDAHPDIVSMTVNDHYVEVSTVEARHLVLIRLTDAIDEIDGVAGVRLHRSHWAAAPHIRGVERRDRKFYARLSDGRDLPVSKTYLDDVRAVLNGKPA